MTNAETIRWLFREFELATTSEVSLAANTRRGVVSCTVGGDIAARRDMRERKERKQNSIIDWYQVALMRKRLGERQRAAA